MTSVIPTQCDACVRLSKGGAPTCEAFPDRIPQRMLTQLGDHRRPIEGDHGLRFEQAPGDAAAKAFDLWQRVSAG